MSNEEERKQVIIVVTTAIIVLIFGLIILGGFLYFFPESIYLSPTITPTSTIAEVDSTKSASPFPPTSESTEKPTEEPIPPQPEKPPTQKTEESQVDPEATEEPPPTEDLTDTPSTLESTEESVTPDPGPSPEVGGSSTPDIPKAIIITTSLNLRIGPGLNYEVIDSFPKGTKLVIQGRTEKGDWIEVISPNPGEGGWVSANTDLVYFIDVNLEDIPIAKEIPPPPITPINTTSPTETLTPTPNSVIVPITMPSLITKTQLYTLTNGSEVIEVRRFPYPPASTPLASGVPLDAPPTLLEPPDRHASPNNRRELAWEYYRNFGPNEYFFLEIWHGTELIDSVWTREQKTYPLEIGAGERHGDFYWRVTVIEGTSAGRKSWDSRYLEGMPGRLVSQPSEIRRLEVAERDNTKPPPKDGGDGGPGCSPTYQGSC